MLSRFFFGLQGVGDFFLGGRGRVWVGVESLTSWDVLPYLATEPHNGRTMLSRFINPIYSFNTGWCIVELCSVKQASKTKKGSCFPRSILASLKLSWVTLIISPIYHRYFLSIHIYIFLSTHRLISSACNFFFENIHNAELIVPHVVYFFSFSKK